MLGPRRCRLRLLPGRGRRRKGGRDGEGGVSHRCSRGAAPGKGKGKGERRRGWGADRLQAYVKGERLGKTARGRQTAHPPSLGAAVARRERLFPPSAPPSVPGRRCQVPVPHVPAPHVPPRRRARTCARSGGGSRRERGRGAFRRAAPAELSLFLPVSWCPALTASSPRLPDPPVPSRRAPGPPRCLPAAGRTAPGGSGSSMGCLFLFLWSPRKQVLGVS